MSDSTAAYRINGELVGREAFYAVACDPARSVAVEACAGAGKTWMLVSRILRALLEGAAPQDILAITFTKKAAAEMRQRLQQWLREFASLDDARLAQELVLRGLAPQRAAAQAAELRGLHARLLATGRPVQIRTFHSWFAALLRSAPLSVLQALGLPAEHELLEDDAQATALVWPRFYAVVTEDPSLRQDFMDSVARHGRHQTLKALGHALNKRVEFALADEHGVVDASVQPFAEVVPSLAGLERPEQALASGAVRARWLGWARELGAEKNKTPQKTADAVVDAFADGTTPGARVAALRKAFFVATEDRLTQHLVKYPAAQAAEAELQTLLLAVRQHEAWLHQQRLARLTRALIVAYRSLKRERGWVDMNDVEGAARRLLGDAECSGWMQQRLDARVRHLLIDEFQDTNPLQWQALYGWLSGYAGAGSGEAPAVFLVGDPKQSIYRFRRAEPQVFKAAQAFVVQGLSGALLSCDHTRRCAMGVVSALNAVMGAAAQDAAYPGFREHTTESPEPGAVLALPAVPRDASEDSSSDPADATWRDSLNTPRVEAEDSLSAREAQQAADWIAAQIARGEVKAEDVMVLSRKRERLGWLHAALAERGIAAEQPEKQDLCDAPAVQDVVALLDALVSPAHDLSLARALRCPILGLGDDALARIARLCRRADAALAAAAAPGDAAPRTAWWDLLQALNVDGSDDPATDALLVQAAQRLARWRQWLATLPPHDALAAIYRDSDLLARYAAAVPARLREPVLASLRALLAHSLAQDGGRYLTAYRLVRALKAGGIRLPPTAQTQAVRLLTIHGAKGLEAHTVLLLDTEARPPPADSMGVLVDWPGEAERPQRFIFLASEKTPPTCAADLLAAEQQARGLEELNALYVALTRAEARIVISSVQPHRSASTPSWRQRIEPQAQPLAFPMPEAAASDDAQGNAGEDAVCPLLDLPVCTAAPLPTPIRVADTVAPDDTRARIGLALHRLLQWVPTPLAGFEWGALHQQAVAREFALTPPQAREALTMARAMLGGEAAWAWDAALLNHWGNEVDIWDQGQLQRMDRLVRRADTGCWWVLDFKSATRPERQAELRAQLQRYHRALSQAHPGQPVRLAFINPLGQLIEIPANPHDASTTP